MSLFVPRLRKKKPAAPDSAPPLQPDATPDDDFALEPLEIPSVKQTRRTRLPTPLYEPVEPYVAPETTHVHPPPERPRKRELLRHRLRHLHHHHHDDVAPS